MDASARTEGDAGEPAAGLRAARTAAGTGRRILLLGHCILNPFTVVEGLSGNPEMARELVTTCLAEGIGLYQLPCPEFTALGARRWTQTKEQYDTPVFREHCLELLGRPTLDMREHVEAGHAIVGCVGIEGSPCCGVRMTTVGYEGGRVNPPDGLPATRKVHGKGVFMEALTAVTEDEGFPLRMLGLPQGDATDEEREGFRQELRALIQAD